MRQPENAQERKWIAMHSTKLLPFTMEAKERLVLHEGGTRSGKTIALCQFFIQKLHAEQGVIITICRKTMPALRGSAMKDFFRLLDEYGLYDRDNHNKSENIYRVGKSEAEFLSIDEWHKVKGRNRDYLWINEADELDFDDFRQLALRTRRQIFMDFNPVDEFHWIAEQIMTRQDSRIIKSTYLDNPFISEEERKEIELLKLGDENYWRIYGLGLRGISSARIYTHWRIGNWPDHPDDITYGIDFGYNNPSAITRVAFKDKALYWDQLLLKSSLTNADLIAELDSLAKEGLITRTMYGWGDAAEPARIEEIRRAGFNIRPAEKDIALGIDFIKRNPLFITPNSTEILKEIKSYMWKTKDGRPIEGEPIKGNDHLLDAARYASFSLAKTA